MYSTQWSAEGIVSKAWVYRYLSLVLPTYMRAFESSNLLLATFREIVLLV